METHITARAALLYELSLGPGFGRELRDRIASRSRGQVRLNDGSLYPTLKALEEEELVARLPAGARGAHGLPAPNSFEITDKGRDAARELGDALREFFAADDASEVKKE